MIHIIDDWYMTADRFCYTVGRLDKKKRKKDGEAEEETYLKNATYHGTIANALRSVCQDEIRDKVAKGKITDLAQAFAEIEKYNTKLVKQFDKAERALSAKRR